MAEILKVELENSKSSGSSEASVQYNKNAKLKIKGFEPLTFRQNLLEVLKDMYTDSCIKEVLINKDENKSISAQPDDLIYICMDNKKVEINLNNMTTLCEEDKHLEQIVSTVVNHLNNLS